LPEEADEKILHAAFIPFGEIMDIQIPLDYETGMNLKNQILY
jgi:peptidyl-prolyl isomerase E (cyclophilin E)